MPFRPALFRPLLAAALLAVAGLALADSWAPPAFQLVASEDGRALARVTPGDPGGRARPEVALYAYAADSGQYTRTARYTLRNRVAPVDALLTGRGELVTLDEWAGVGRGTVLRVYAADGTPRLEYSLEDLLGEKAAAAAPQTVSSTWWRCRTPKLGRNDAMLLVDTYDDGKLRVELATGKVEFEPGKGRCR